MKINVHAGHNPDGKIACGAVGLVKESTVAREIKKEVIAYMQQLGHTVYDCTVDNGTGQNDVLKKIVAKCNENEVDADISIHLNSGRNDSAGDNSIGGTEILVYSDDSEVLEMAIRITQKFEELGFRLRSDNTSPVKGVKVKPGLYVLKHTDAPALLIETFFCDDADDVKLYQNIGAKGMAKVIVEGITGQFVNKNDINGDGKIDLADAQEALKQGLGVTNGDATLEDANEILKEAIGVVETKTDAVPSPAPVPAPKPAEAQKPQTATKKNAKVLEWQKAAIKDGFEFPKYGADGQWGSECESVAEKAVIKKRTSNGKAVYKYPNLTRIVQKTVGVKVDGKCGDDTSDAIGAYQRTHGLKDDECVGLNTWKKILL